MVKKYNKHHREERSHKALLWRALIASQTRHTVAIWRLLRIVAQCHPHMMEEALKSISY